MATPGNPIVGDITLGLALLNSLLGWIGQLRSQSGLTDDALAAQVQTVTQGNDAAYQAMMAALAPPKA